MEALYYVKSHTPELLVLDSDAFAKSGKLATSGVKPGSRLPDFQTNYNANKISYKRSLSISSHFDQRYNSSKV